MRIKHRQQQQNIVNAVVMIGNITDFLIFMAVLTNWVTFICASNMQKPFPLLLFPFIYDFFFFTVARGKWNNIPPSAFIERQTRKIFNVINPKHSFYLFIRNHLLLSLRSCCVRSSYSHIPMEYVLYHFSFYFVFFFSFVFISTFVPLRIWFIWMKLSKHKLALDTLSFSFTLSSSRCQCSLLSLSSFLAVQINSYELWCLVAIPHLSHINKLHGTKQPNPWSGYFALFVVEPKPPPTTPHMTHSFSRLHSKGARARPVTMQCV